MSGYSECNKLNTSPSWGGPASLLRRWGGGLAPTPHGALKGARPPPHQGEG
jgi:hypothetical protein